MGYLGVPYRILYLAKGYRSGLTDVVAVVVKPNGGMVGVFPMREFPAPFTGQYYYDYLSGQGDPQGEYFSLVISPTEQTQDSARISLYNPVPTTIQAISQTPVAVSGLVKTGSVVGFVQSDDVSGATGNNPSVQGATGSVQAVGQVGTDNLSASVQNSPIINGEVTTGGII